MTGTWSSTDRVPACPVHGKCGFSPCDRKAPILSMNPGRFETFLVVASGLLWLLMVGLAGAGHWLMETHADPVNAALLAWFKNEEA